MTSPTFRRLLWVLLVALAMIAGYLQIFTLFILYDDEGYILISLNHFAQSGDLYHQVYSQYGPLFYLIFGGLARWGNFVWSHDLGRLVTLGHWVGSAGLGAWICYQLTRSHLASALAFAGTFVHLWQMAAEPMHPGGALACWIALGTGLSLKFLLAERPTHFAVTVAVTAGCCALVKVNVGGFFAAAGVMWLLFNRRFRGPWGALFDWLIVVLAALGPMVLMLRSLDQAWASIYALVGGVAIGSVGAIARQRAHSDFPLRSALIGVGSAAAVVAITTGAIWICGTSPTQLFQGSILGPLRHADVYHFAFNWRTGTVVGTLISALLCVGMLRGTLSRSWSYDLIGGGRLIVIAAMVLGSFTLPPRLLGPIMSTFGITLWWLVISPAPSHSPLAHGRTWLGLLVSWQFLHAYPVAGSQIGWGTFLWIPLAVTAAHESCRRWVATRSIPSLWRTKLVPWGTGIAAAALVLGQLQAGLIYLGLAAPLDLTGARHLRLSPSLASSFRIMVRNAQLESDSLFSFPGAFSFNLWSELASPTAANVTHWFSLLDDSRQLEIQQQLRRRSTPVIVQPQIVRTHLQEFIDPEAPLVKYLYNNYDSRTEIGLLALWRAHTDERIVVNVAEQFTPTHSNSTPLPARIISLKIAFPATTQIVAVEVGIFQPNGTASPSGQFWHQGNTAVEARPISATGIPLAGATFQPLGWPLATTGLHHFNFYPAEALPPVPLSRIWLRFRDGNGTVVGEARFANE